MTIVPLSRAYVHFPWPIATFNVMSKPGGAGCNLACEYCFYRHNAAESRDQKVESRNENDPVACGALISDDLLETFIADYIAAQGNPTVFFAWQGGEPTLAGLDFYRRVIELQKQHARTGVKIANALQTNGVLLDAQWCRFLAENRWAVGLSIDGPADIHDFFRRSPGGGGSFAQVRAAADRLGKHNVPLRYAHDSHAGEREPGG